MPHSCPFCCLASLARGTSLFLPRCQSSLSMRTCLNQGSDCLHPVVVEIIRYYGVAPSQIVPNGLNSRKKMVTEQPSSIHDWKEKLFFISSSDQRYSLPLVNRWRMVKMAYHNLKPSLTSVDVGALNLLEGGAQVAFYEVKDNAALRQHQILANLYLDDVNLNELLGAEPTILGALIVPPPPAKTTPSKDKGKSPLLPSAKDTLAKQTSGILINALLTPGSQDLQKRPVDLDSKDAPFTTLKRFFSRSQR
ncbi:hypothetical protein NE237_017300 [Protea cynaroides]|uniref:Uncharacterized protein n=1 Tax=Protea cynaroides TaxID=273540 RepID=A0A9Q0K7T5_9MAGN|nr:hypothetical protein NE237_017300 [Protea cynaroides]